MSEYGYELIPGTALPVHRGPQGVQDEGRQSVEIQPGRGPVSLFEKISSRDDVTPAELVWLEAAVRAMDARPRKIKTMFPTQAGNCDATTGNLVLPLFVCPAGCEGHVTNVTIDAPGSATITPSAPYSNAASWAILSVTSQATGDSSGANATRYRPGMVAFAPTSAAGPFIPGQWTFNHNSSPVMFGGDELTLVIVGGSIAALLGLTIQATARVELEGYEQ